MDIGIIAAVLMLALWVVGMATWEAPGWFHLLLTVGVFLLAVRIGTRERLPANDKERERPR